MQQLLIELDDELAAKLEEVASGRSRKRSEFVRNAIRKALWELEEALTAVAYRRRPDAAEDAYFDPRVWERTEPRRSRRPKK
jgi:predicted transcriptional regulator